MRIKHWRQFEYFHETWRERISLMASFIGAAKVVADLGCGKQWLKDYLSADCEYIPVDYVARSDDTIVCDFNRYDFPNIYADVIFVSGVLEYIVDIDWFIEQAINHADEQVVLSYTCFGGAPGEERARRRNNWVNALTFEDVVLKFKDGGMQLEHHTTVLGNVVFVFVRQRKRNPYGILIYPTAIQNLGDYTQAAAVVAITGRADDAVCLRREHLHEYRGKPIPLICNGWFSHGPVEPPSSRLHPLYISLHITERAKPSFAQPSMLAHLAAHAPIGCRDTATLTFMKTHGIDAYYSACVTLALGKKMRAEGREITKSCGEEIYIVDPPVRKPDSILAKLFLLARGALYPSVITRGWGTAVQKVSFLRKLGHMMYFSGIYGGLVNSLGKRHVVFHSQLVPIGKGNARCKDLFARTLHEVDRYRMARALITSRIHAALPAVAAGANVVFLVPEKVTSPERGRIDDHLGYFENSFVLSRGAVPTDEVLNAINNPPGSASSREDIDAIIQRQRRTVTSFLDDDQRRKNASAHQSVPEKDSGEAA